jgi:hypothetical protein
VHVDGADEIDERRDSQDRSAPVGQAASGTDGGAVSRTLLPAKHRGIVTPTMRPIRRAGPIAVNGGEVPPAEG